MIPVPLFELMRRAIAAQPGRGRAISHGRTVFFPYRETFCLLGDTNGCSICGFGGDDRT
jgi:hypothetical protein